MQKYQDVVLDSNGNALQGATIAVYDAGSGALSTIYSDNSLTASSNPVTTDATGNFYFYAENGRYNLVATYGGVVLNKTDVLIEDTNQTTPTYGAAFVSYKATGTGAVSIDVETKLQSQAVSPIEFGAVGDGVADDTAELQALIDAHDVIDLGDQTKTYKITSTLDLSAGNKTIIASGATIDMRSIPSGNLWGMKAIGTGLGTSKAITGATVGVYTVNCADTTGFAADDYVQVTSSDNYSYGGGSYNVNKGEIKQIRSIVANTSITFTTPLNDTYTTTPLLYPISWCNNITVNGVRFLGSNIPNRLERGLVLQYVKNFLIEDCEFDGQDIYQIECTSSIFGWIKRNKFHSALYYGVTGIIFYGVSVMDCSQWIEVSENVGNRLRHLVITTARTSGQGFVGQPYYVNIHHNKMFDAMSGGGGRSFAYEVHGFGRFITIDSNIADGCYSGLRLENAYDTVVSNNVFTNYGYQGIIIGGTSGDVVSNLIVANNNISKYTGEVTAGLPCGIRVEVIGTVDGLKVIGNTIRDAYNSTGAVGQGISIGANTYTNTCIDHNVVDAGADSSAYAISVASGANGIMLTGNRTYRYRGGFNISSNYCTVKNNIAENDTVKATGFAYYSNGDRNIIQGNVARNMASALRADTASTNNLFINNQAVQCTTGTFSNAGVGNTGRDNDVI